MKNAVREYFPGSNTPEGFYSYYDYILKSREAKRIIVLKGGPGTGKSSFMKRVASHLSSLGYDVELLHCSSDPHSLDGVCAREIGFLILDGTAPHVVDPKTPGAVDEIINLGSCWDKEKMLGEKNKIIETNEEIAERFAKAYRYLTSAKYLQNQFEHDMMLLTDAAGVKAELYEIEKSLGLNSFSVENGSERKAFLSAITPLGEKNYIDTFAHNAKYVYNVESDFAPNTDMFMRGLAKLFTQSGIDIRSFYCPMSPDKKIEHIYIPSTDTFFTVRNAHHRANSGEDACVIDLNRYVKTQDITPGISADMELYNLLVNKAIDTIAEAKKLHDELETHYIPHMDFDRVGELCANLISSIC